MPAWIILITDNGQEFQADITNADTANQMTLRQSYTPDDKDSRDEAISELFSGSGLNIRDDFDTV